jgi:hypothetical protein
MKRFLNGPSIAEQPQVQHPVVQAVRPRGVGHSHGRAADINAAIVALIIALLARCSPAAVLWCVWPVDIDSIERVLRRRSAAHVGQKRSVVVAPSIANGDSSSTIVGVVRALLLITTPSGADPCLEFLHSWLVSPRVAMREKSLAMHLDSEAVTATRLSAQKVVSIERLLASAIATTLHALRSAVGYYRQAIEARSDVNGLHEAILPVNTHYHTVPA